MAELIWSLSSLADVNYTLSVQLIITAFPLEFYKIATMPAQTPVTAIFVQEPDNQGFTAFFAQFPNIIAEGDTEQESENNLIQLVNDVFTHEDEIA